MASKAFCPELKQVTSMRVERTRQAALRRPGPKQPEFVVQPVQDEAGRAVLVLEAPDAVETPTSYRAAQFLAHLIATKDQLPQTRERRRADPAEAIAAYTAADALTDRH